jgi:hypothetical protein
MAACSGRKEAPRSDRADCMHIITQVTRVVRRHAERSCPTSIFERFRSVVNDHSFLYALGLRVTCSRGRACLVSVNCVHQIYRGVTVSPVHACP